MTYGDLSGARPLSLLFVNVFIVRGWRLYRLRGSPFTCRTHASSSSCQSSKRTAFSNYWRPYRARAFACTLAGFFFAERFHDALQRQNAIAKDITRMQRAHGWRGKTRLSCISLSIVMTILLSPYLSLGWVPSIFFPQLFI